jgi:hypothetical protein
MLSVLAFNYFFIYLLFSVSCGLEGGGDKCVLASSFLIGTRLVII